MKPNDVDRTNETGNRSSARVLYVVDGCDGTTLGTCYRPRAMRENVMARDKFIVVVFPDRHS